MPRPLDDYDAKRDFDATPEPPGDAHDSPTGRLYVIHKHAASRLHYDLRLENDGVLLSWAVPKGPSLDTKQRRLAVHVEDHPVDYGSFEGTIPEGEYGGGTVMLWDHGTWSPHGDVNESIAAGKLVFDLHGEKLTGRFGLIHTGARKTGRDQNQWLLIKEKDDHVRSADEYEVTEAETRSATTGRTMEEIASGDEADEDPELPDPAAAPGVRRGAMPDEPRPQLATAAPHPPGTGDWLHEIKHDGYRLMIRIEDGVARALTREGHDWSARFPTLMAAAARVPASTALIDCEAVVLAGGGVSDFGALQAALRDDDPQAVEAFCFDLLHLDGWDLTQTPLSIRKSLLFALLAAGGPGSARLHYADHVTGDLEAIIASACALGAEGIVSKRVDAPYRPGRSKTWIKSKCLHRQEFVVVGHRPAKSGGLGALLLAYYEDDEPTYAGRVGTGFSERTSRDLLERLAPLAAEQPPVVSSRAADVTWVKPQLVVEVAFAEWSPKGLLRHASFKGIREDKDPRSVTRDVPAGTQTKTRDDASVAPVVAGITITHPERVMVPDGPTKLELAEYYATASPAVLEHLAGRPITLLRCPDGAGEPCFWQRHLDEDVVPHVRSFAALDRQYVTLDGTEGLVALVQHLTVEFHVWGSTVEHPDRPDRLVFDLDPGEGVEWDDVRAAALLVREVLSAHGLRSFLKTSGGKGLHVVTPIVPRVPVAQAAAATKSLSMEAVASSGDMLTIDPRKDRRTGRIFVDWHRNGAGQSTVAPYVVRARPGGPVSTPITWDELRDGLDPATLTLQAAIARISSGLDPWADIGSLEQHLPQEAFDL